ncbi:hypothetical protein [Acetobacter fabarum]|uniref:hypothetical protein n=1 Tax=Acetobacter fabarum TaxID=483199 RepID=UPI0039E7F910
MKSTDDRKLFGTPIGAAAVAGNIAVIPQTQATAGDGTASVALGFPPETFIARAAGGEPPRGQDMNGLLNLLSSAMQVLQAGWIGAFDAGFAQSIGGYPAGAIVAGVVPGTFWVSTVEANVSTPGAQGAGWQSLFNGYATQAWANVQFLQLALATLQKVTGPVAFAGPTTVPDVTAFAGGDALNAKTAEGRYVKSAPAAGQTRITDLTQNTDGRAVFGNGTNTAVLASLADLPLSSPSLQIQEFSVTGDNSSAVTTTFPVAFKAGTVPKIWLRINNEPNSNAWTRLAHMRLDAQYNEIIDNTGFTWGATYLAFTSNGNSAAPFTLSVCAIGEKQ